MHCLRLSFCPDAFTAGHIAGPTIAVPRCTTTHTCTISQNLIMRSLNAAARDGDFRRVVELIKSGSDVRTVKRGKTPLHWAAINGHLLIVQTLLQAGAEPDAADSEGATALFYAVERNLKDVAEMLIQGGADVNVRNQTGETLLKVAVLERNNEVYEVLKAAGAHFGREPTEEDKRLVQAMKNSNQFLAEHAFEGAEEKIGDLAERLEKYYNKQVDKWRLKWHVVLVTYLIPIGQHMNEVMVRLCCLSDPSVGKTRSDSDLKDGLPQNVRQLTADPLFNDNNDPAELEPRPSMSSIRRPATRALTRSLTATSNAAAPPFNTSSSAREIEAAPSRPVGAPPASEGETPGVQSAPSVPPIVLEGMVHPADAGLSDAAKLAGGQERVEQTFSKDPFAPDSPTEPPLDSPSGVSGSKQEKKWTASRLIPGSSSPRMMQYPYGQATSLSALDPERMRPLTPSELSNLALHLYTIEKADPECVVKSSAMHGAATGGGSPRGPLSPRFETPTILPQHAVSPEPGIGPQASLKRRVGSARTMIHQPLEASELPFRIGSARAGPRNKDPSNLANSPICSIRPRTSSGRPSLLGPGASPRQENGKLTPLQMAETLAMNDRLGRLAFKETRF